MDPATTIAALGAIAAWLALAQSMRATEIERAGQEMQDAIDAICTAAEGTREYAAIAEAPIGNGTQARDREREIRISNLWMRAGDLLDTVDYELAQRCAVKSGYWETPEGWTDVQVKQANIQLEDIYEKACALRRTRRE